MTGFPINPPTTTLIDQQGRAAPEFYRFLLAIQRKIGGPSDPFEDIAFLTALPRSPTEPASSGLVPPPIPVAGADDPLLPYGAQRDAALDADKQPRDATLTALAALDSSSGLIAQTGADAFAKRTLTGTANEITIANGSGAAGNPTASLPAAITLSGKTITGGTFADLTSVEVDGPVQCDSFRLDQTPTAESVVCTHTITVSVDGTDYKIPCVAA